MKATADLVDPDPTRKEIRATVAKRRQAGPGPAGPAAGPATDLPPASAVMLGTGVLKQNRMWQERWRDSPAGADCALSDFWLLVNLSLCLCFGSPDDPVARAEGVGCAQTLVALYPNIAFSYVIMVNVLRKMDPASA